MKRPTWMQRALRQNRSKAEKYLNDPGKLRRLVDDVQRKVGEVERSDSPIAGAVGFVALGTRLMTAYARGEYRAMPWGVLVAIVSALLYFLMPMDAVPDVFVGIGLLDDAAVLAFVATQVKTDLDRFAKWEHEHRLTVDSTATRGEADAAASSVESAMIESVSDVYLGPGADPPEAAADVDAGEEFAVPPDADQVDGARAWFPVRKSRPK